MCLQSLTLLIMFTLFYSHAFALKKVISFSIFTLLLQIWTCLIVKLSLQSYIVYLGSHAHPSTLLSQAHLDRVAHSHRTFLASFSGRYHPKKEGCLILYFSTLHETNCLSILQPSKCRRGHLLLIQKTYQWLRRCSWRQRSFRNRQ